MYYIYMKTANDEKIWCTCRSAHRQKEGWTRVGWWWVRPGCHKPTQAFVINLLTGHRNVPNIDLNLFQSGEHHNELWTVAELLYGRDGGDCASWITGYAWTEETMTGSETGRVARVWRASE